MVATSDESDAASGRLQQFFQRLKSFLWHHCAWAYLCRHGHTEQRLVWPSAGHTNDWKWLAKPTAGHFIRSAATASGFKRVVGRSGAKTSALSGGSGWIERLFFAAAPV